LATVEKHVRPTMGDFYGSDEWRSSFDEKVMALIESYHVVVAPLSSDLQRALASVIA